MKTAFPSKEPGLPLKSLKRKPKRPPKFATWASTWSSSPTNSATSSTISTGSEWDLPSRKPNFFSVKRRTWVGRKTWYVALGKAWDCNTVRKVSTQFGEFHTQIFLRYPILNYCTKKNSYSCLQGRLG